MRLFKERESDVVQIGLSQPNDQKEWFTLRKRKRPSIDRGAFASYSARLVIRPLPPPVLALISINQARFDIARPTRSNDPGLGISGGVQRSRFVVPRHSRNEPCSSSQSAGETKNSWMAEIHFNYWSEQIFISEWHRKLRALVQNKTVPGRIETINRPQVRDQTNIQTRGYRSETN